MCAAGNIYRRMHSCYFQYSNMCVIATVISVILVFPAVVHGGICTSSADVTQAGVHH